MRGCPRCKTPYHSDVEFCGIDGEKLVEMDVDPMIGATIDRYRVVERLGGGGMAAVYRAVHTVIDRECALKVLFGELASDRAFAERFRREARAASEIKHENVVEILDFGTTKEGASFLLMELLKGTTLAAALPKNGLAPERAALILRDIACGLAAAHARGFVHRDLKPQNIMLVDDNARVAAKERAKILDFGLVAEQKDNGEALTKTGQTLGTPSYMAPEQIDGKECTPKSDLYSLGVILYEMLAGSRPFNGTLGEILLKHRSEPPPPLAPSKGLDELALKLLAKAPADRPASAADVVRAIEALGLVNEPPAVLPDPASSSGELATRTDRKKDGVSATAETRVSNVPSLPSSAILKVSDSAIVDDEPIAAPARFSTAAKVGVVAAIAAIAAGAYVVKSSSLLSSSDAIDGGPSATTPLANVQDKVVDVGQKAVDRALGDPSTQDAGVDEATAKKAAVEKANDDVINALKRRSLSWNEAESLPGMRTFFGAFERAKNGDPSGLRAATKDLVHEIARAPISARILEQRVDKVGRELKRATLPKPKRSEYEKKLDGIRSQARRKLTEAERNRLFVEAVALDDRINP